MNTADSLLAKYDGDSDVLYLALGMPVPAESDEDEDGLLVRYAKSDGHACGVTIIGFRSDKWDVRVERLASLVGEHLHVPPQAVSAAIFNLPLLH